MQFGITAARIDDIGFFKHAENLGYDFAWVTDSPLLRSNPWAVLALAAQQTQRIRLGTGLEIGALRLAPVAANGIATINRLAPGRTFLGVGTGNTAMRTMGQRPMRIAEFREHIRVVRALLDGQEVDYTLNGVTHPIRFENPHYKYVDLEHYIPIHVGGFGPRAQALAGELGDGLITGIPRGGTISQALANVARGAAQVGRKLSDKFETTALVNLLMLEPGDRLTDAHVINQCGSSIMVNVHFAVEQVKETGCEPPDYVKPIWDEYMAFHTARAAERGNQELHLSHYSFLDPAEARFVTPDMIRRFCIAGQPEEIVEQLRDLEKQGLNGINFIAPQELRYRVLEDFARKVMATM
jgi:alkanesulfonate monooxygenase SsuD/methylene tetrahydromethanopterin reductase-like flavin-dependent oxidoreductase (luciferase family)